MTDWQLGLRAFREGRMREATDRLPHGANDYERTVTQKVRFQTLAFLGAALYALGDPSEAVSVFENAVRLAPGPSVPADLNVNLANAYLAVGRREDARNALQAALKDAPGHVEARMMLQRLDNSPADQTVAGSVLGESPEGVKSYLRTLSFARVGSGGYDPAQVRQALQQIEHYIDFLISEVNSRDATISSQELELNRLHQMEDVMIQKMLETNQTAASESDAADASGDDGLSPLERLFQKKA